MPGLPPGVNAVQAAAGGARRNVLTSRPRQASPRLAQISVAKMQAGRGTPAAPRNVAAWFSGAGRGRALRCSGGQRGHPWSTDARLGPPTCLLGIGTGGGPRPVSSCPCGVGGALGAGGPGTAAAQAVSQVCDFGAHRVRAEAMLSHAMRRSPFRSRARVPRTPAHRGHRFVARKRGLD